MHGKHVSENNTIWTIYELMLPLLEILKACLQHTIIWTDKTGSVFVLFEMASVIGEYYKHQV